MNAHRTHVGAIRWILASIVLAVLLVTSILALSAPSQPIPTVRHLKGRLMTLVADGHASTAIQFMMGPAADKQTAPRYAGTPACDRRAVDVYVGAIATGNRDLVVVAQAVQIIVTVDTLAAHGPFYATAQGVARRLFPAQAGDVLTVPAAVVRHAARNATRYLAICGALPGFAEGLISTRTGIAADMRAGEAVRGLVTAGQR